MFESRISAGASTKLPDSEKVNPNGVAWSYYMEGHQQTEIGQLSWISTPCIDDHQFKKEELDTWENCQTFALKSSCNAIIWRASAEVCKQTGKSNELD